MKAFAVFSFLTFVTVAVGAGPRSNQSNALRNYWKPAGWLSASQLEALPALNEITMQHLEGMTLEEGANLINKMYHLIMAQNRLFEPTYVLNANELPTYMVQCDGRYESFTWNQLVQRMQQTDNFNQQEVTIFITGYDNATRTVAKANRNLVEAYQQRYTNDKRYNYKYEDDQKAQDYKNYNNEQIFGCSGLLLVVDLGKKLGQDNEKWLQLDIEHTGDIIAETILKLTDELNVPHETLHIVAQGIAAHVAGASGRAFTRMTGHQLRRITGLDPSKIIARRPNTLMGLARGDAEFVDVIHSSAYGLGVAVPMGDADFYPNGPAAGVPGAENVVDATMRATRFFAESVRPGNERNFPAVAANSLEQYRENRGHGRRAFMGIATDFDVEGNFVLEVNPHAPFGQQKPAQKQDYFHNVHRPWTGKKY